MTFRDKVVKILRKKAKSAKREGGAPAVVQTLQDILSMRPTASRAEVLEALSRNGTSDLIGDPNEL